MACMRQLRGRDVLVVISLFLVYSNMGIFSINGLLGEEFREAFGCGEATTTWIASLQFSVALMAGFLSGSLLELYGSRRVCLIGTSLVTFGFISSVFVPNVTLLYLTISVISGIGFGLQHMPCLTVPNLVFDEGRVLAVSVVCAGPGFAFFVYPILFDYCRQMYGFRGGMLIMSGIILNSLPLAILMTSHPDLPTLSKGTVQKGGEISRNCKKDMTCNKMDNGTRPNGIVEEIALEESGSFKTKNFNCGTCLKELCDNPEVGGAVRFLVVGTISRVPIRPPRGQLWMGQDMIHLKHIAVEVRQGLLELRHSDCLLVFLVVFVYAGAFQIPFLFLPIRAKELGFNKQQGALLITSIGLTSMLARLSSGVLGSLLRKQIPIIFGLALITCSVACVMFMHSTSFQVLQVISVIYGIGDGMVQSLYTQSALAFVGLDKIVRMIALCSMAWSLTTLMMPSLSGVLFEATQTLSIPFYLAAGLYGMSAALQLGYTAYRLSPFYTINQPGTFMAKEPVATHDLLSKDEIAVATGSNHTVPGSLTHKLMDPKHTGLCVSLLSLRSVTSRDGSIG